MTKLVLTGLTILLAALPAAAMSNEDCFGCHDDAEMTSEAGRSVHVGEDHLKGSVHEDFDCIDCHEGGDFEDEPHWQGSPKVDCGACHDEVAETWTEHFDQHLKGKNHDGPIPGCADCHGTHDIRADKAAGEAQCMSCHTEQTDQYHDSFHAQRHPGDSREYPTCTTCHDPHIKDKRAVLGVTAFKQETVLVCEQCHQKDIETYVHSTHYRRLAEDNDSRAPACVDCHESHSIFKPSDSRSRVHSGNVSETCDACHTGHRESLHKEAGQAEPGVSCVFCHTGHQTDMTSIADRIFKEGGIFNKCNYCHDQSQHEGVEQAHGDMMHIDEQGQEVNCTECHQYHWQVVEGVGIPRKTHSACGVCHDKEEEAWLSSAHGRSREAGNEDAPACGDCHGETEILKTELHFDAETIVSTCAECHSDHDLMLSYGLNPYVVEGYRDTYHGKLYALEEEGVHFALCTDCHGYHAILEKEDPESTVNSEQILGTCRSCHEKANKKFVSYLSHPVKPTAGEIARAKQLGDKHHPRPSRVDSVHLHDDQDDGGAFLIAFSTADRFMKILFVVVIGFFGLHTVLWWQRGIHPRLRHFDKRYFTRFSPMDRALHIMVNISFLMLAFTGLPQSYSHTVLGKWVFDNAMSLKTAQQLHYIAALITFLYFVLHTVQWMLKIKRHGWRPVLTGPESMVPRKKDFTDFAQHLRWFFGKAEKPRFDRWTYWEKFDYLAVFWGVAIIGLSGLIRWQEEFFGNLLGGGVVSLADTIHAEEALMAAAFIFIVHFFNTHLRTEKFPMDVSIYTGLITEEELKEERPEQFERLRASGDLDKRLRGPRSTWAQIFAYAWGAFALLLGLWLLALIIFGMVAGGH